MQTLFAILFAFASLLGPWLCCCAPRVVLAQSAPVEDDCPFCKKSKPEQPKQDQMPCPCTKTSLPEMVAAEGKISGISIATVEPQVTMYVVPLEGVAIDLNAATVVANELPFLPSKSRLRVHHVMHC